VRLSNWARHVIICLDDAFPIGTVKSLKAAEARDCFAVIDAALDMGEGFPHLWASVRENLESEFLYLTRPDYEILTFHIEPAHAHVLIRQASAFALDATVERWKARAFLGTRFPPAFARNIWAPGYYDTVLTEPEAIEAARAAIDSHPPPPWMR
jgi:hypothetical protein